MARGLQRAGIVAAALEVLDTRGIAAVTVRAVAAQLGVQAPALYHHVRDKQDLLDEMGTEITRRVVARLRERDSTGDWADDLEAYARALRAEYLAHRDGARTFSGTRINDPDLLRALEPWFRRWVGSGVPPEAAFDAFDLVTAFVVGFVIEEQERAQSAGDPTRYAAGHRESRLGPDVPLVAEAGHARRDPQAAFDRHLHTVLTGIEASAAG
jgi:TetR/AcrR family transcriptional regulator, tetracycline repressor protein